MKARRVVCAVLLGAFCSVFGQAGAAARLSRSPTSDVRSPRCGTFVQRKILADLGVTLTSRGAFRFEEGRFFEWRVEKPVPSVFFATPTNYSFTVRGRTTTHPLAVDVSSFKDVFEIKEMKQYVAGVTVHPETGFPTRVEVRFKNGDRMEMDLTEGAGRP